MNKKTAASLFLGIVISVVALYLSFRNVPLHELSAYVSSIRYVWIIPAGSAVILSFALRALRWQVILASSGEVGFLTAFHILMTGFMMNCVLPGRIGEIARPIILKKKENIPFSTGLATVAVERVFDISLLLLLFVVVLSIVDIDPNLDMTFGDYDLSRDTLINIGKGMVYLSVFLIVGILIMSFGKTRQWINQCITGIPKIFFFVHQNTKQQMLDRIFIPLVRIIDNFAVGFSFITSPKKVIICIGLSLMVWGLSAYSYYLMVKGCPGIDLSFAELTAVMVMICFFIALPSVPGFWGIWEAGGVFAMSLFGISTKNAAGFTLINHAIQVFPVILIGMVSAIILGINILHVSREKR